MLLLSASDIHANILLLGLPYIPYIHHVSLSLGATDALLVEKLMVSKILLLQRGDNIHKICLGACLFNILPFVSRNHWRLLHGRHP